MSVNLLSVTSDAEYNILYIARVSSDQTNQNAGLIKYLIRNNHWSPFEMAHMVLEIETSRAISAQICRHRSFSFQEFSQRYSEVEGIVKYHARRQADKNRQSSVDDLDESTIEWFYYAQGIVEGFTTRIYKQALEKGIAKECARFLLPLSSKTRLYMAGSVRSWIHYIELRSDEHTQQEHREIALQAKAIFCDNFPVISEALGWTIEKQKTFHDLRGNELPHPDILT